MNSDSDQLLKRRRWLSFSLRTLLIAGPFVAIAISFLIRWWYLGYLEQQAITALNQVYASVERNEDNRIIRVALSGGKKVTKGQNDLLNRSDPFDFLF